MDNIKIKDSRKFNWTMVENEMIDNFERYTKNEVMAYLVIARYANSDSQCFPSYKTIAEKMRCSKRTAIDVIKSLVEKGVLIKETRVIPGSSENTSNLYTLVGAEETREITEEVERIRAEKRAKAEEKKNIDDHPNLEAIKTYLPDLRLGRNQKLELIKLDKTILEKAVDRTALHGGNSYNYLIMTYGSIKKELELGLLEDEETKEFEITNKHEAAFIKLNDQGYNNLKPEEKFLIDQLKIAGIINDIPLGNH